MGRKTPFGPDLMKTGAIFDQSDFSITSPGISYPQAIGWAVAAFPEPWVEIFRQAWLGRYEHRAWTTMQLPVSSSNRRTFTAHPYRSPPIFGVSASSDVRITVEQSSGRPIRRPHQSGLGSPH